MHMKGHCLISRHWKFMNYTSSSVSCLLNCWNLQIYSQLLHNVPCTCVISFSFLFGFPLLKMVSICCQTMQYVLCTNLEKSPQINPIIGRIECKAGHGAGRPTQKMVTFNYIFFTFFSYFFPKVVLCYCLLVNYRSLDLLLTD